MCQPLSDVPANLKVDSTGPAAMTVGEHPDDVLCLLKRHMSDTELSQVGFRKFNANGWYLDDSYGFTRFIHT